MKFVPTEAFAPEGWAGVEDVDWARAAEASRVEPRRPAASVNFFIHHLPIAFSVEV
jgi:hypothetical protein